MILSGYSLYLYGTDRNNAVPTSHCAGFVFSRWWFCGEIKLGVFDETGRSGSQDIELNMGMRYCDR